jgi:hypothetical protein
MRAASLTTKLGFGERRCADMIPLIAWMKHSRHIRCSAVAPFDKAGPAFVRRVVEAPPFVLPAMRFPPPESNQLQVGYPHSLGVLVA